MPNPLPAFQQLPIAHSQWCAEAHEVLSKTPRGEFFLQPEVSCPEASPIKASDNPLGTPLNAISVIAGTPKLTCSPQSAIGASL
jgi:hypothetical protein